VNGFLLYRNNWLEQIYRASENSTGPYTFVHGDGKYPCQIYPRVSKMGKSALRPLFRDPAGSYIKNRTSDCLFHCLALLYPFVGTAVC